MNDPGPDTTLDPNANNAPAWNARYLADDMPWDKQAPCPGLVDWLAKQTEAPGELGRWLIPGCGLGHDVQALASAGADALGIDLSPAAAEGATALGRSVIVADLFDLPAEWTGSFDGVWEHTCFCAIHPEQRPAYVTAVHRVLKPGGTFLGIFFDPETDSPEGPPFKTRFDTVRAFFTAKFEPLPESDHASDWVPRRQHRAASERMLWLRSKR